MKNIKEIQTIQTAMGELRYYRDWDKQEGGIVMIEPQTISLYKRLKNEHPDSDECGVFVAFNDKQFEDGYKHLIELGHIKDGDKIISIVEGIYGTEQSIKKFSDFYSNRDERIKAECDPQEVYFYEYNNHESMFAFGGDVDAIKIIINIWGADVAKTIKRYNNSISVDYIIRKPIPMQGLYFEYNGEHRQPRYLQFDANGLCWTAVRNDFYHVYDRNNNVLSIEELCNINAYYDGKQIHNCHR